MRPRFRCRRIEIAASTRTMGFVAVAIIFESRRGVLRSLFKAVAEHRALSRSQRHASSLLRNRLPLVAHPHRASPLCGGPLNRCAAIPATGATPPHCRFVRGTRFRRAGTARRCCSYAVLRCPLQLCIQDKMQLLLHPLLQSTLLLVSHRDHRAVSDTAEAVGRTLHCEQSSVERCGTDRLRSSSSCTHDVAVLMSSLLLWLIHQTPLPPLHTNSQSWPRSTVHCASV